jgi:hypothetical protein
MARLYGGTFSTELFQNDKRFRAEFEMSNSGEGGFWVKITTYEENG